MQVKASRFSFHQVYPHILDQLNREKEKESLLMTHVHELGQQLYRLDIYGPLIRLTPR